MLIYRRRNGGISTPVGNMIGLLPFISWGRFRVKVLKFRQFGDIWGDLATFSLRMRRNCDL